MRGLVVVGLVALLGACSVEVDSADGPAGGYEMQIAADETTQIYLISGPDGVRTAARVEAGVSGVMDSNEARLALGEARAAAADAGPPSGNERVRIDLPGFEFSVAADENGAASERAQIKINAGGREVHVDASGEDEAGRAVVRITGASADDARDFINEAEDLTPETKQQMLTELGLAEAPQ
ncbi:MAG: hypothetical protein NW206_06010 [Hyphomonadaceae bacterium]|nr:hypothetical protein [Hyphomonadaceae bacterium]